MSEQNNFLMNISMLYRSTQKYLDRALAPYEIGSGQLMFLVLVNENEGITMQELTKISEVDKGTTTKSIQRLIESEYVVTHTDEKDRRVKRLYTTGKAAELVRFMYESRMRLRNLLKDDVDFERFETDLNKICDNARERLGVRSDYSGIKIGRIEKSSFTAYSGKLSCIIYVAGCGFKCPYCREKDLVFIPENYEYVDPANVISFLKKRQTLLDAVCISGGEPLAQKDIESFLDEIKNLGYPVKLVTNGFYPDRLVELVEDGLVDYVAMDVKNVPAKYAETCGMRDEAFDLSRIEESIAYLKKGNVEHEFATTVVKEFHSMEDIGKIAEWVADGSPYFLQAFSPHGNLIQMGLTAYGKDEMKTFKAHAMKFNPMTTLRGAEG